MPRGGTNAFMNCASPPDNCVVGPHGAKVRSNAARFFLISLALNSKTRMAEVFTFVHTIIQTRFAEAVNELSKHDAYRSAMPQYRRITAMQKNSI
jgi:hypothetical protein